MSKIGIGLDPRAGAAQGLAARAAAGNTTAQQVARARSATAAVSHPIKAPELPTVSFNGTGLSGGVEKYTWDNANGRPNPDIGFIDYPRANIIAYGPSFPQYNIASSAAAVVDTSGMALTVAVDFVGKSIDLILYGNASSTTVWINDVFLGRFSVPARTGTAQGGAADSITLDSGASGVAGYYNEYYATITGGTGTVGETRRITAYNNGTKVATISGTWTVTPDATTTFAIVNNAYGIALDGVTGAGKYLHLVFPTRGKNRIRVHSGGLMGFRTGTYGMFAPAPAPSGVPLLIVGDSFWAGSADPNEDPILAQQVAEHIGARLVNLSSGSTGVVTPSVGTAGLQRLNFRDRICPPAEAWRVTHTATGGTYTISVTVNGVTQTTGALDRYASNATVETALNALSNVSGVGDFCVARWDFGAPRIYLAHNLPGATLAFDTGSLTGGTITVLGQYVGDVEMNRPKDADGNGLPFILLVPGSGNDSAQSDAAVQAGFTAIAAAISSRWPECIPIFTGVVGDALSSSDTISSGMISRNAAIRNAALLLPKINGQVPFIDTYANGLGGKVWLYGSGTVATPTAGTRVAGKSVTNSGHPTGYGVGIISALMGGSLSALFRTGSASPA